MGPSKGATYNGTIVIKGCATLDGEYTTGAVADKSARFFRAFLE